MKIVFTILIIVFCFNSNCISQSQEYYEFKKEKKSLTGFSVTPFVGLSLMPGDNTTTLLLKTEYTFGNYLTTGLYYSHTDYILFPQKKYYYSNSNDRNNRVHFIIGGQYPISNFFSIEGGLGLLFSFKEKDVKDFSNFGLGFKLTQKISLKPQLIAFEDNLICGIGCKYKF